MYLDQAATFWGSGFRAFEPVTVSLNAGTAKAELGSTTANAGGGWSFTIAETNLGAVASVSDNMAALMDAGIVTAMATGADGTLASVPIMVGEKMPVALVPSIASSMMAGPMADPGKFVAGAVVNGGMMTLIGAGFTPGGGAAVTALTGLGSAGEIKTSSVGLVVVNANGVFIKDFNVSLAPGSYTLEARGVGGSYATAPLWVAQAP